MRFARARVLTARAAEQPPAATARARRGTAGRCPNCAAARRRGAEGFAGRGVGGGGSRDRALARRPSVPPSLLLPVPHPLPPSAQGGGAARRGARRAAKGHRSSAPQSTRRQTQSRARTRRARARLGLRRPHVTRGADRWRGGRAGLCPAIHGKPTRPPATTRRHSVGQHSVSRSVVRQGGRPVRGGGRPKDHPRRGTPTPLRAGASRGAPRGPARGPNPGGRARPAGAHVRAQAPSCRENILLRCAPT